MFTEMVQKLRSGFRRPSLGTSLAFVAVVVSLGGVAYASIPSADGTIKACYATNSTLTHSKGDARIVDQAEACRSYEKSVAWNQSTSGARAYVSVDPQGNVLPGTEKNIVSVTHVTTGLYCVTLASSVPAASSAPVASIHDNQIANSYIIAAEPQTSDCTNGVQVMTAVAVTADRGFTDAVHSFDEGFSLAVP